MTDNHDPSLTIDTHHHILPDFFWKEINAHAPVGGLAPLQWSKEVMISFMDDAGIDVAVTSISTPGVHLGDSEQARSLARRCNEFAAKLVHDRPDRFASFACIPLPDIDASLEELWYALDVLKLDGSRSDAFHEQVRVHAKREVHLLARRTVDPFFGGAFCDH